MSTCRNCRKFCTEKFMKCTECAKPFHFKCQSITAYVIGGKSKKPWVCTFCKTIIENENDSSSVDSDTELTND
jgi:hypothetical protein